jgi:hypothetical protein
MTTHPFLSDEWMDAVATLKAGRGGAGLDEAGFRVNGTITGVPFGDGTIEVHSEHGPVIGWLKGHADDADLSFTVDYFTAKALVLDLSPTFDALSSALANGTLTVSGDRERLARWWRSRIGNPEALALEDEVRSITR